MIQLLNFLNDVAKSNLSLLHAPYKLNFCITYICQSRCLTCNIWQRRPKGELTLEEIQSLAKNSPFVKWLQITGGEPFVRSDIDKIAQAFAKNLYILSIPTNSLCDTRMVKEKVKSILSFGIPNFVLTLSLDGYEQLHDTIRGVHGNFRRVIETYNSLEGLQSKHFKIVFGYTMSRMNEGKLAETIQRMTRLLPQISADDFHLNLAQNSGNYYENLENDITPNKQVAIAELKQFLPMRSNSFNKFNFIETRFVKGLISFSESGKSPLLTKELESSCFLDSFGHVYPSIMWDESIGNIRQSGYDLRKLWYNNKAQEICDVIKNGGSPQHWTSCESYQTMLGHLFSGVV